MRGEDRGSPKRDRREGGRPAIAALKRPRYTDGKRSGARRRCVGTSGAEEARFDQAREAITSRENNYVGRRRRQIAETAGLVRQSLDRLGEPCREIIELRYYGDLSYDEIAAELRLNPKTVSSRLSKCLDRLLNIAKEIFPSDKHLPSNL